jgi:hypothetical protein
MGEEIGFTVTFGGKIKRADVERIAELEYYIGTEGIEDAAKRGAPAIVDGKSNYGEVEDLTDLLQEINIAYVHCIDAKYECDGNAMSFDPAAREVSYALCTQSGEPAITLKDLKELSLAGADLARAIDLLERTSKDSIPPVEIVEETESVP